MHLTESELSDLRDDLLTTGECLADPELHSGPDPHTACVESPEARAAREDVAREVCQSCPVAAKCLTYALHTRPARGIWAGFTAGQIRALSDLVMTPPDRPVVVAIDEAVHLFTGSADLSADTAEMVVVNMLTGGIPRFGKGGLDRRDVA
jgi:hypothetical protein